MKFFCLLLLVNVIGIYGLGLFNFGDNGYTHVTKLLNQNASKLADAEKKWIKQRLDHYDQAENRTWKMMYYQDLNYWKPDGPIYLYLNGEAPLYPPLDTDTYYRQLAKETNGALFFTEHRYYGQSMPVDSFTTDNLKYLSSRQALADLAHLIQTIKTSPIFQSSPDSKVVVIGGSYAGNLAAWMKLKYPNLVDVAVASSAPVLAKVNFFEYLEKVSDDFKELGPSGCYEKIVEMFNRYEHLFNSAEGIQQLKKEENICNETDMTILENKQMFFSSKIDDFAYTAQYGLPGNITEYCKQIMEHKIPNLKTERKHVREENDCIPYDFNKAIYNTINTPGVAWDYQTCTEFGYYQTTSSYKQPFTKNVPADYYYKMCMGLFGPQFNETRVQNAVKTTNDFYGGKSPNVTNVVFVNGDMDPWSRLGILNDLSSDAPAIVIPKSSHCGERSPITNKDSKELIAARNKIKCLIKKWLGLGA